MSSRRKLYTTVSNFLEDTFLVRKMNNWFGYSVILLIAIAFGCLFVDHATIGLGIFVALLGLGIGIACMASAEIGLYVIITFSFFAFVISRLLFRGNLQVGVIFDVLVLVTFMGLFIRGKGFKESFNQFLKTPVVVWMLVLLFYLGFELFNPQSRSFDGWFMAFRKYLSSILLLYIAYALFNKYDVVKRFIDFLFWSCVIAAVYGCIQQWHGYFNFEMEVIMSDPHGFGLIFVEGEFRKFSTMSDPAAFGILMAVCVVFFLILATGEKKASKRWVMIIGCIFMIMSTGYSGTRTAYAIIIAGIAFYIMLNFDKKNTRVFAIIATAVFLLLMYGPYSNKTIYRFRTTFAGQKDESFNVRVINRKNIQPYIYTHPIGGGLGSSGASGMVFHPGHYLAGFQPDSSYLKKAVETGWVGLIIILIQYFVIMKIAIIAFFRMRSQKIKLVYVAVISGMFAFYVAEFAQVAIGQISDIVVYFPFIALILKLKDDDEPNEPAAPAEQVTA